MAVLVLTLQRADCLFEMRLLLTVIQVMRFKGLLNLFKFTLVLLEQSILFACMRFQLRYSFQLRVNHEVLLLKFLALLFLFCLFQFVFFAGLLTQLYFLLFKQG